MGVSVSKAHWERIHENKDPTEVSWYQAAPELSLKLVGETGLGRDAPIIDVGGGASQLAARLLDARYGDVTVARHLRHRPGARSRGHRRPREGDQLG
jgi:hypothetical protein